jgi:serine protein kinase
MTGGYHDVKAFRETIYSRLLAAWEYELYAASGLVQEEKYAELFDRYVQHVSAWVKKERLYSRATQKYEEPDEKVMGEVERLIDVKEDAEESRRQLISAIAAWALDHPGQKVEAVIVFPQHLRRMREAIFAEQRPAVARLARDLSLLVRGQGGGLDAEGLRNAEAAIDGMISRFGYCRNCAADAASALVRKRFQDLVT